MELNMLKTHVLDVHVDLWVLEIQRNPGVKAQRPGRMSARSLTDSLSQSHPGVESQSFSTVV